MEQLAQSALRELFISTENNYAGCRNAGHAERVRHHQRPCTGPCCAWTTSMKRRCNRSRRRCQHWYATFKTNLAPARRALHETDMAFCLARRPRGGTEILSGARPPLFVCRWSVPSWTGVTSASTTRRFYHPRRHGDGHLYCAGAGRQPAVRTGQDRGSVLAWQAITQRSGNLRNRAVPGKNCATFTVDRRFFPADPYRP